MYQVPLEHFFRLHHVRPRFKGNLESVLWFLAVEISQVPELPTKEFAEALNTAILKYPGNADRASKTINNWRTEISTFFAFLQSDNNRTKPSNMVKSLASTPDLTKFFRNFLYTFQYPGAHIKSFEVLRQTQIGLNFKPAQYILKVLTAADKLERTTMSITKTEVANTIFNDLRCTKDNDSGEITWQRIKENRIHSEIYDKHPDTIRYAFDILHYMYLAKLLDTDDNNYYRLDYSSKETIDAFLNSTIYFNEFEALFQKGKLTTKEIKKTSNDWFDYVNTNLLYH